MKIRHQLLLSHGLLVALALTIIAVNVSTYKELESDAYIINQAGKLRMLSYNMAQLANRLNNGYDRSAAVRSKLQLRMDEFETILSELRGAGKKRAPVKHRESLEKLKEINDAWLEGVKPLYINVIRGEDISGNCRKINQTVDYFVRSINEMVTAYSVFAKGKVTGAFPLNGMLVLVIIVIAVYSFEATNRRIRKPMNLLMKELQAQIPEEEAPGCRKKRVGANEFSEMSEYLSEMMYDQLTRAYNRRAGLARLSRILEGGDGTPPEMSICFIDINGLKDVNDQLGHEAGDELIVSAVEVIRQEIRKEDFIVRMGGDEFLILFQSADRDAAEKVWSRIVRRYDAINREEDRPYRISVSHGIVEYDVFERSQVERAIKQADDRMYREKKFMKEKLKVEVIKQPVG